MINTLATDEEFLKRVSDDFIVVKWKVHKINLIDFGPIYGWHDFTIATFRTYRHWAWRLP